MTAGAVVAIVAAATGGCVRAAPGAELPDPLPTDVPFAYHLQTVSGSGGAGLEGVLELRDGCLVVIPTYEGATEPAEPVVPVLPIAVTTWDGTTLTVGQESAEVGSPISLGGGYHDTPVEGAFVPDGCPVAAVEGYLTVGI